MNDMDFMIHIVQNLPDEYKNVVDLFEYELKEELLDIEKSKSNYEQNTKES